MSAKLLCVSLGVGIRRLHTAIAQSFSFFVSVAHAVVLENAGTKGFYKKSCFSSRLYSLMLQVRAPESREREPKYGANHFKGDWCCDTYRGGTSWRNLSVVLPKFGSTTDENREGTSHNQQRSLLKKAARSWEATMR